MIIFRFSDKNEIQRWLPQLFSILHGNMSVIAPTGNTYHDDYAAWCGAVGRAMQKENRKLLLVFDDDALIGYLQYYTNDEVFMTEEAQIIPAYRGRGILRSAFAFIADFISPDILYAEAYASKQNTRSQNILERRGFACIGENKNSKSYHYRADCRALLRYIKENTSDL